MKVLKQIILLKIIIAIFGMTGYSQDYQKMLSEENSWFHLDAFESAYTLEYRTIGDSIINDIEYKKVYYGQPDNLRMDKPYFLIREDTIARQVFIIPQGDTKEHLAYDFSIEVGDTISIPQLRYPSDSLKYVLDSISGLDNIGSNNRVFFLNKVDHEEWEYDAYIIWIEGIGSISGIENNCTRWNWPEINTLICAYQGENQTYFYEPQLWFEPEDNCNITYTGLNNEEDIVINVSPNPASDYIKIDGIDGKPEIRIEIIGITGKIFYNKKMNKKLLNISELTTGLYILSIYSNSKKLYSQKLLIQ